MANHVCIFPVGKQAEALAYKAACDAHYAANFEENGIFGYCRPDSTGDWVVPYYGPPWSFDGVTPFPEPASCLALRVDAVVVETPEWPVPSVLAVSRQPRRDAHR